MREISDVNILKKFCEEFCTIVERHCKYIVVSGYLAIATGRSRATQDIDMILERINEKKYSELHKDLVQNGFVCVQGDTVHDVYEYLSDNTCIRYVYKDTFLPEMEVKLAKDIIDSIQLANRMKIPLTNVDVYFSPIEMNIAFKEEYLKSEKDLEDAKHFRIVFKEDIDEERIHKLKKLIRDVRLK